MFENLTDRLNGVLNQLTKRGTLREVDNAVELLKKIVEFLTIAGFADLEILS